MHPTHETGLTLIRLALRAAAVALLGLGLGSCGGGTETGGGSGGGGGGGGGGSGDVGAAAPALIAGGTSHTCIVDLAGDVFCWGANDVGQLGNGGRAASARPVQVEGVAGVVAITAGGDHTCALQQDGALLCWGAGGQGQLGQGLFLDSLEPVAVERLPGTAVAVAAGRTHTCAVADNDLTYCWGSNANGQLGRATTGTGAVASTFVPLQVPGVPTGTVALAAGWEHTCAARAVGAPRCWGANAQGQAGNGTTDAVATAALVQGVPGTSRVLSLAGGASHSCALTDDGDLFCWGSNGSGELGNDTVSAQPATSAVLVEREPNNVFTSLSLGDRFSCATSELLSGRRGEAMCWGRNDNGQLGQDPAALPVVTVPTDVRALNAATFDFIAIGSGENHTCAITDNDSLRCWGVNTDGQLGNGVPSAQEDIPVSPIGFQ